MILITYQLWEIPPHPRKITTKVKTVVTLQTEQHIFNQAFEDIKKTCKIRNFKTKHFYEF